MHARLNEIGTLELWCSEAEGSRSWQLQFDVRSATQTEMSGHSGVGEAAGLIDQEYLDVAAAVHTKFLREEGIREANRNRETPRTHIADGPRKNGRQHYCEVCGRVLLDCEPSRQLSADHEGRWINILGFCLRPGFGVAMDDWRVAETWKILNGKLHFTGPASITEWWILWRRIAGGLTTGQQKSLALPLVTNLKERLKKQQQVPEAEPEPEQTRGRKSRKKAPRNRRSKPQGNSHELAESWRMLGSFERLPLGMKIEIAELASATLDESDSGAIEPALLWTLGSYRSEATILRTAQQCCPR